MTYFLDNEYDIFNDEFWQSIAKTKGVKDVIDNKIVVDLLEKPKKEYCKLTKKDNQEYIAILKKVHEIDVLEESARKKGRKADAVQFELLFKGYNITEKEMDSPNPFSQLNFSYDDNQLMTIGEKYGCPLKLLRLSNFQASVQLLYAKNKNYITDADWLMFKHLVPDFIFVVEDSEEFDAYFNNKVTSLLNQCRIGKESEINNVDFFCPKTNNPYASASNHHEQIETFKNFLCEYIGDESDEEKSTNKSYAEHIKIAHTAQEYYAIFKKLCCHRKSSQKGYFSMQSCKEDSQRLQQEQCYKEFEQVMKKLIVEEAKKSFYTYTDGTSKFLGSFLNESPYVAVLWGKAASSKP